MGDKDSSVLSCLGLIAIFLIVAVVGTISQGWAISVLWGWFVVPTFGLPQITILQAFGISLVLSVASGRYYNSAKSDDESVTAAYIKLILLSFVPALFSVFTGWIIHSLM